MQKEQYSQINLSTIANIIRLNLKFFIKLLIPMLIIVICLIVGLSLNQKATYTTTGILQVNNLSPLISSDEPSLEPLGSSSSNQDVDVRGLASNSETISSLLKTEYILKKIIYDNNLDIEIKPTAKSGLINRAKAFLMTKDVTPPKIITLDTAHKYYNYPLTLSFISPTIYEVYDKKTRLVRGKIGSLVKNDDISILVVSAPKPLEQKFVLTKHSIDLVITKLAKKLDIEPVIIMKKSSQSDTGLIKITITDYDPVRQADLINDIMEEVQVKTWEQQRQNLKQSIAFLESQSAIAKNKLNNDQNNLTHFQTKNKVIDIDNKARDNQANLSDLDMKILDKQMTIDQFKNLYTLKHPLQISLHQQYAQLQKSRQTIQQDMDKMPADAATYASIKRSLDFDQQVYMLLINKEQDLKVRFAGISSLISILNYATPNVAPNLSPLSVKFLASGVIGVLVFEILMILYITIWNNSNPFDVAERFDSQLLAIIPNLKDKKGQVSFQHPMINIINAYFSGNNPTNEKFGKCFNFGSIYSGAGKTFVISLLAKYLGSQGKHVLIINFNQSSGFKPLNEVLLSLKNNTYLFNKENRVVNFQIKAENAININDFEQLLFWAAENYDYIFIESLPILKSVLFMRIASLITKNNILISQPEDSNKSLAVLEAAFDNLEIHISRVIFNYPRKLFLNTPDSVNNFK